jgi:hypothetical protein
MEWNLQNMPGEEATAWNIDRLVTVEIKTGGRPGRCIMFPMYEAAVELNNNKPISLTAAQKLVDLVKADDAVILMTGMGAMPFMPKGETDGPPGIASLARAIDYGLKGLPVLVVPPRDYDATLNCVRAAGLVVLPPEEARATTAKSAVVIRFTEVDDEADKAVKQIFDDYDPKAVISVEMFGPNNKNVKHFGSGKAVEAYGERFPSVEKFFSTAAEKGVLTIGCLDVGNEVGSGSIEETIRKHVPFADVCQCDCKGGLTCAVKCDVAFPASVSNWAAYAITAMIGYLLRQPELLQDATMEKLMLEATAMGGSIDGCLGAPIPAADGIHWQNHGAMVSLLRNIVESALSGASIAGQIDK